MAVYAEFFGLPGTGKTTVCGALKRAVTGLAPENRVILYPEIVRLPAARVISGGFRLRLLFLLSRFSQENGCGRISKRVLAAWVNAVKVLSVCGQLPENVYVIADQSLLQNLLSILHDRRIVRTGICGRIITYYYAFIADPLIVCTELDRARLSERLEARPTAQSRADGMDREQLDKFLDIQYDNYLYIRECLKDIGMILDMSQPPESSADAVLKNLRRSGSVPRPEAYSQLKEGI